MSGAPGPEPAATARLLVDGQVDEPDVQRSLVLVRELEAAGCDGIFLGEGGWDPLVRLPLLAQQTTRAQLGTAVAIAPPRSPMHVAYAAHDIQVLSGGRLVLGLGHQVAAHLVRRFSVDASRPVAKMREYVLSLRAIWASWYEGAVLDFEGEIYRFNLMTPMFTPHGAASAPPVWLAGVGPGMTKLAGEVADGIFLHPFTTVRFVQTVTEEWLREGAKTRTLADRPAISLPVMMSLWENDQERSEAQEAVRRQIAFYASTPTYRNVLEAHGWEDAQPELRQLSRDGRWPEMIRLVDDDMLDAFSCSGHPDQLAAALIGRWGGTIDRTAVHTPGYTPRPELVRGLIEQLRGVAVPQNP